MNKSINECTLTGK